MFQMSIAPYHTKAVQMASQKQNKTSNYFRFIKDYTYKYICVVNLLSNLIKHPPYLHFRVLNGGYRPVVIMISVIQSEHFFFQTNADSPKCIINLKYILLWSVTPDLQLTLFVFSSQVDVCLCSLFVVLTKLGEFHACSCVGTIQTSMGLLLHNVHPT